MGRNKRLALAFFRSIAEASPPGPTAATSTPKPAPRLWTPSAALINFLRLLAETPYQWRLKKGMIRTGDVPEDCPITGVVRHLEGEQYGTASWNAAARRIDRMLDAEGELVVNAAGNVQGHIPQLRALLLTATVNRPAAPSLAAPRPDPPMDQAIAELLTRGSVPAKREREEELVPA